MLVDTDTATSIQLEYVQAFILLASITTLMQTTVLLPDTRYNNSGVTGEAELDMDKYCTVQVL